MGRLGSAPKTNRAAAPHPRPPPPADDPWIAHFSHSHHLQLTSPDQSPTSPICAGCNTRATGVAYSCKPCNYVVDLSCAKMPRRVRHPAHTHSLNILAVKPPREGAPSDCAACGSGSAGFMFRCDPCGYELHCQCAAKPLSVNHRGHAHALHLVFSPPYEDKVFSCDVCAGGGADHWLYRCAGCDFDAHIGCVTAATLQVAASQTPATRQQAPSRPPPTTQKLQASASSTVAQEQTQQRRRARQQAASPPVTGPQQLRTRRPLAPPPQAPGWPATPHPVQQGPLRSSPAPGLQRPPPPRSMRQRTRQQPLQQQPQQGNQGPDDNGGGDRENGEEDIEADATEGGGEGEYGSGGGNSSGDYSSHDGGDHDGSTWVQSQHGGDPESNWPNQDAGDQESNWMPGQDEGSSWTPNEDGGDYETNFMLSCSIEESDGSNFVMDCSLGESDECYAENSYQE